MEGRVGGDLAFGRGIEQQGEVGMQLERGCFRRGRRGQRVAGQRLDKDRVGRRLQAGRKAVAGHEGRRQRAQRRQRDDGQRHAQAAAGRTGAISGRRGRVPGLCRGVGGRGKRLRRQHADQFLRRKAQRMPGLDVGTAVGAMGQRALQADAVGRTRHAEHAGGVGFGQPAHQTQQQRRTRAVADP